MYKRLISCWALSLVSVTIGLLVIVNPACSHDFIDPGQYKWSPLRLSYMPVGRVLSPVVSPSNLQASSTPILVPGSGPALVPGLPPMLRYVIVLPNRWANNGDIHVCFRGGSDALRKRILDAAVPWFQYANLHLITGSPYGKTMNNRTIVRFELDSTSQDIGPT